MWIATTKGFFSAVQHRDDTDLLVVRTRHHDDAQTLMEWYGHWRDGLTAWCAQAKVPAPSDAVAPEPAIITYEHSDYPWRVILPRTAWGAFVAEAVEDLTYGNFKAAVADAQGTEREAVYHHVWAALLRLEDLDPLGRPQTVLEDDEPWGDDDPWCSGGAWHQDDAGRYVPGVSE